MIIEMHKVGYAHRSVANWNYYVWNVYSDKARVQCSETFGGDYRLRVKLEALGHTVEVFTSFNIGKFGVREVEKMPDIESDEVVKILTT